MILSPRKQAVWLLILSSLSLAVNARTSQRGAEEGGDDDLLVAAGTPKKKGRGKGSALRSAVRGLSNTMTTTSGKGPTEKEEEERRRLSFFGRLNPRSAHSGGSDVEDAEVEAAEEDLSFLAGAFGEYQASKEQDEEQDLSFLAKYQEMYDRSTSGGDVGDPKKKGEGEGMYNAFAETGAPKQKGEGMYQAAPEAGGDVGGAKKKGEGRRRR